MSGVIRRHLHELGTLTQRLEDRLGSVKVRSRQAPISSQLIAHVAPFNRPCLYTLADLVSINPSSTSQ